MLRAQTPVTMLPLQGDWKAAANGWQTQGVRPPAGWYLRSERQFDVGAFSLEIKKANADELVFIYLRDWQICLRPDAVTARYSGFAGATTRVWGKYWNTATRPFDYRTKEWKSFTIELAGGGIALRCDGKELLKFSSPDEEWTQRVKASGRFATFPPYVYPAKLENSTGQKQVLIVQGYGKGLEVRGLSVSGTDAGIAENFFTSEGKAEIIPAEEDLPLHRPKGVLSVDWKLDATEATRIGRFAKVTEWSVPAKDFAETTPDVQKDIPGPRPGVPPFPEVMEYRPGTADPGRVPNALSLRKRFAALPQECRVAFNLAEAGVYTVQLGWGNYGMGWGPNILEISVDGKPIVLEEYRALMKFYPCSPGMESLPLKLEAGPHRIDVRLVTDRYGFHFLMKFLKFPIGTLRLVKGGDIPWKNVDVRRPTEVTQQSPATDSDFVNGEWNGPELNYRMTGLIPGAAYTVKLFFADYETTEKGSRLINIDINHNTVEKSFDIYAEGGWGHLLEKKYTATAQPDGKSGGQIEIQLKGIKRKALVNGITVSGPDGAIVFKENFGWHVMLDQYVQKKQNTVTMPRLAPTAIAAEPPKWTPEEIFDGHNVAANPHFSLVDADRGGKPKYWLSFRELQEWNPAKNFLAHYRPYPGKGEFVQDAKVGRSDPGAVKIGRTEESFGLTGNLVVVDPNKRQKFSFFVKGEKGAAPVRAAIVWVSKNMDSDGPLPAPNFQIFATTRGEPVTAQADWKEVVVEAKPPTEAIFALLVIEAGGNSGASLWVDDAEFNGYGAEPLEITRSFAGFHPRGEKTMIAKSFSGEPVTWKIKRASGGVVVAQGEVKEPRFEWFSKRYYFPLDFAAVREPGDYIIDIAQGAAKATESFKISPQVYRDLTLTMLQSLHSRRFNGAVENVRDPQLFDYAAAVKTLFADRFCVYEPLQSKERIDLTGGYYDAGDEIQHTEFWPAVIAATFNSVSHAADDKELLAKSSAEADWIVDAFYKFGLDDGTIYTTCKPQGFGLDNIPMYSYDPVAAIPYNVTQTAGAAAMAAYALREKNPQLSRRYVEMAENNYEASKLWEIVASAAEVGPKEISAAAKSLWAEMYLNKISKKADYSGRMAKSAEVLAKGLKNRAYADLSEMFEAASENGAALQDCVWVPVLFAREYPSHPAVPQLKEGLKAFAAHVAELSADTIWGQAAAMNGVKEKETPKRFPGGQRQGGYWPMLAYSLAEVGMLLGDEKTILLAERQLQWCLGRNFADLSAVQGIGTRYVEGGDLVSWQDVYFNHWLQSPGQAMIIAGNVPTDAFRDVGDGKTLMHDSKANMPVPYIFPAGYGVLVPQPYYGTRPGRNPSASEPYLPQIAQFNLAAASVNAALKSLEKK